MSSLANQFARLGKPYADPATDRELITRFHRSRDEAAFAAIVDRHGAMVLGACRRVLRDTHAADDAFQATFFILAKKAGAVRWQDSLGGWLYMVSQNVCRKAMIKLLRKPLRPLPEGVEPVQPQQPAASELSGILDEELRSLPTGHRDAIVLCHLQGHTVDDAAKELGISEGQLRGRLHRGREKLRERLTQRGVALSLSALAIALTATKSSALSAALKTTLAEGIGAVSNGTWSTVVSAPAFALTQEVLATMVRTKLQWIALFSMTLVGGFFTAGVAFQSTQAQQPTTVVPNAPRANAVDESPVSKETRVEDEVKIDRREGVIKSVDGNGNKLVITLDDNFDLTVELEPKVEIAVARRPVKLAELTVGMRAGASFKGVEKKAFQLEAFWPKLDTVVKGSDAAKSILVIKTEGNNGFEFEVPLPVAADAKIELEGLSVGLGDLAAGSKVQVEFALDKKTVLGILAEGSKDDLPAVVKTVDVPNKTVILSVKIAGVRDEHHVDLSFSVTADAKFRLVGKDITLAELKPDMPVVARFATDRRTINRMFAVPPVPKDEKKDE